MTTGTNKVVTNQNKKKSNESLAVLYQTTKCN